MSKITNLFRSTFFLVGCILLCNGCTRIKGPSSFGDMTLTLTGIFAHCSSHLNSNQVITFSGVVQVFHSSTRIPMDPVAFNSNANPATPVVVKVKVPSDNATKYDIEIIVNGSQCSKCAVQSFNGDECLQYTDTAYHAARPRLDFQSYPFTTYYSTYTFDLSRESFGGNVPGSCTCVVPQ